ncbi:hypothetical protein RXV86_05810 [Alisedimentitalea sp. MJ-SS2]|uniref:hypothetical protein n=1 Tax=Aliisedimentitalea sp. MJ-SS2 TaxID=3049795 RepID=UPI0029121D18|nr:hypothetical protein [Alisedimentitalea sp. MJ-SS2]MDU8926892.1 hypothetical protein [Alisedimentitalea sp. MJ-SS2]
MFLKRAYPPLLALVVSISHTLATHAKQLEPGEYFLVDVPDALNYHHVHSDQDRNLRISEFVPRGQNVNNWREMVTIMTFRGLRGVTARQFAERMIADADNECATCSGELLQKGRLEGYRFALTMLSVPRPASGTSPEWNLGLVIRGKDSMYLVMKAWRQNPSPKDVTQWRSILSKARICDNRVKGVTCATD